MVHSVEHCYYLANSTYSLCLAAISLAESAADGQISCWYADATAAIVHAAAAAAVNC